MKPKQLHLLQQRYQVVADEAPPTAESTPKTLHALYRVTRADVRTEHGVEYSELSLVAWVDSMQEKVKLGLLCGFLDHPDGVYDWFGYPVDFRDDTHARIFIVETLEWDPEERSVKAWVRYLDSHMAGYVSEQIQKGAKPQVSLRVIAACDYEGVCDVKPGVGGFDQVSRGAMLGAELLEFRMDSSPFLPKKRHVGDCGCSQCRNKSRAGTSCPAVKQDRRPNMDVLKGILKKAKGIKDAKPLKLYLQGALSPQAIRDAIGEDVLGRIQELQSPEEIKLYLEGVFAGQGIEATEDPAPKMDGTNEEDKKKEGDQNQEGNGPMMDSRNISTLVSAAVATAVKPLADRLAVYDARDEEAKKKAAAKDAVKAKVSEILSQKEVAGIKLDGFSENELNFIKQQALNCDSVETAEMVVKTNLATLSSNRPATALAAMGFNGPAGLMGRTVDSVKDGQPWMEIITKLEAARDAQSYAKDPARHLERESIRKANARKVDSMLGTMTREHYEALTAAANYQRSKAIADSGRVTESNFFKFVRDSAEYTPDVANAVFYSDVIQRKVLSDLTALQFMRGIGPAGFQNQAGSAAQIGRVIFLESETPKYGAGNSFRFARNGSFRKVSTQTTRRSYFTQDRGCYQEIDRAEAVALMSGPIRYDLAAMQMLRMEEAIIHEIEFEAWYENQLSIQEVGMVERSNENVQNVAPSGSGPLNFTGEYKYSDTGIVTIGGQTYGKSGSNIIAAIRVRGGNTTNTAFPNVPIVLPRRTFELDINGKEITDVKNQVIVKVDGDPLTEGIFSANREGILKADGTEPGGGDLLFAVDYNEGIICLNDNTGVGADPTAAPVQVTKYWQDTNFYLWKLSKEEGMTEREYNTQFLTLTTNEANKLASSQNIAPDVMVLPTLRAGVVENADLTDALKSPAGAYLSSVYSPQNYIAAHGTIAITKTNSPFPLDSGMLFRNGMGVFAYGKELEVSAPYKLGKIVSGANIPDNKLYVDMWDQDLIATPGVFDPNTGERLNFPAKRIKFYG